MGYDHVVVVVETDRIDSCLVAGVFANVLGRHHIRQDDVLVSSPCDELGVVFADVQRVDIVIVDVLVVLYHQIFGRIVETHAAVLGTCHTVFSTVVVLDGVDGAGVDLGQLAIGDGEFIGVGMEHRLRLVIIITASLINWHSMDYPQQ